MVEGVYIIIPYLILIHVIKIIYECSPSPLILLSSFPHHWINLWVIKFFAYRLLVCPLIRSSVEDLKKKKEIKYVHLSLSAIWPHPTISYHKNHCPGSHEFSDFGKPSPAYYYIYSAWSKLSRIVEDFLKK